ncbi:uncharacterized protein SETTUDRAFT_32036 [Exserohilum turcica Et28A]|uniref:Uncharacterized protein n=1 Tax=Exserohilum turcicum (strain 28A) TaxID=671987 RepID=R0IIN1_EXST2|nr:uncharacterized protein SETTUDRAFT_32036 [Exserohilum turcica Et28A]EOA84796.1 hypothetical protein SETTUDRAFT_32036 [Exserohilum turcica Et28A]
MQRSHGLPWPALPLPCRRPAIHRPRLLLPGPVDLSKPHAAAAAAPAAAPAAAAAAPAAAAPVAEYAPSLLPADRLSRHYSLAPTLVSRRRQASRHFQASVHAYVYVHGGYYY